MPPTTEPTVSDIYYKLGGLEGKLDAHHLALSKELVVTAERLNDHSKRIGSLEQGRAKTAGMILVISPLVAAVVSVAIAFLKGLFA